VKIAPLLPVLALLVATHCSKDRPHNYGPVASASGGQIDPSPVSTGRVPTTDEVKPVYPLDAGPPDPLTHKLCSALHDLSEERRASCCTERPGMVVTSECERMLTSAVASKAVALEATEVDRCATAMEKAHEGCDWIGPFPPETPSECEGLVHGSLPVGARCRSSLECVPGVRCHGVGPTTLGVCGAKHADGQTCGAAVDSLAVFAKQQAYLERAHSECSGYCDHLRCAPLAPPGEPCRSGSQCADGACATGKCAPHVVGKPGDACPTGECSDGARCMEGRCVERRGEGAACKSDLECRGACLKSDGGPGACGRLCSAR
jgi:hypothetical protein